MLAIKKNDLQSIINHCIAGLPNEACGMLGGRDGGVEKVYLMRNAKPGPDYFEMDAEEQFRVMKELRAAGLDLVCLFHSHPAGKAYPSGVDVERAYWPGTQLPNYPDATYMIVSLMDLTRPVVRGFTIAEGSVAEVPLTVA
jgi:[CysO sulfur-carrier protein]-S-L-cysteine hydrolase